MGLQVLGELGPRFASSSADFYDAGWYLVRGCTRISPGCDHCSAADMAAVDWAGHGYTASEDGISVFTGKVTVDGDLLSAPRRLEQPRSWLVCPTADLFHVKVPDAFIEAAVATMEVTTRHRYYLLTKRSARMRRFFRSRKVPVNVWLGASIENRRWQWRADELRDIATDHRWISAEPLLEDLDVDLAGIGFVAAGAEVGLHRRPCEPAWMRSLHQRCKAAGVPFFTKHILDGQTVRELPR